MIVELAVWVLPVVAVISYIIGILTEKRIGRQKSAGEILVDDNSGKIMFNFSIMPDDLVDMRYILMDVRKVTLTNINDNSDSDETD